MTDKATTEELAQWLETTANNDADQEAWVSASKLRQAAARLRELERKSAVFEQAESDCSAAMARALNERDEADELLGRAAALLEAENKRLWTALKSREETPS